MRNAAGFQRMHVGAGDITAKIAKTAEEDGNVTRVYRPEGAILFDRPAALMNQPMN
jgi:hypothetical protein